MVTSWVRRLAATVTATVTAVAIAGQGVPASAKAPAPPKATSPAAQSAPLVPLKHRHLADATLKPRATSSFTVPTSSASAVVLSVSVVAPAASGTLTLFPSGAKRPGVVSVSLVRRRAATATVVVPAGAKGRVTVFNGSSAREHVVVTLLGYYATPGTTAATTAFVPVPSRRIASLAGKAGVVQAVTALSRGGIPSAEVSAVVLSVTVHAPARDGAVVLFPYGTTSPKASTFGFAAGRSATSLVIVKPGSRGRIALVARAKAKVRVYVDVVGYLRVLRVPGAPAATAMATIGGATVSWHAPLTDGGAPVTGYHVVVSPGGAAVDVGASTTTAAFPGLLRGTAYTFAVTARNSIGVGLAGTTAGVSPLTLPSPPISVQALADGIATVALSWLAPFDTGTSPVSGYRVTASPGGATTVTASTSATLGGLTSGQLYTFTVTALTSVGESLPSPASGTVTAGGVSRASVTTEGAQGEASAYNRPGVSADGRYVVFAYGDNSLGGTGPKVDNVYVRDRLLDTTTPVSVTPSGQTGNSFSEEPSISADGRYVAFASMASDLVAGDTNGKEDVFVRDLQAGVTTLLSKTVLPADDASILPAISADGSHVVFESYADNLVLGDTNAQPDLFEVTVASGALQPVSVAYSGGLANNGSDEPAVSADGRYVAWNSNATNLVATPSTSGTNRQIYRRDMQAGVTVMISSGILMASGDEASDGAAISADGNLVAFSSFASNVETGGSGIHDSEDIYVRDVAAATTTRISQTSAGVEGNDDSENAVLSADGRYVAFASDATNLVPVSSATDKESIFRYDRQTGVMQLVSIANDGTHTNDYASEAAVSADGQHVAWPSYATNLVVGDTNGKPDLFVGDLG